MRLGFGFMVRNKTSRVRHLNTTMAVRAEFLVMAGIALVDSPDRRDILNSLSILIRVHFALRLFRDLSLGFLDRISLLCRQLAMVSHEVRREMALGFQIEIRRMAG